MITKDNGEIVSLKEITCISNLSKTRGLMFRKKQNLIMIFNKEQRICLHNCFVFFPIDIILLNKDKKVIEIKKNFKPFTLWTSKNKANYVLELAYPTKIEIGDNLILNYKKKKASRDTP